MSDVERRQTTTVRYSVRFSIQNVLNNEDHPMNDGGNPVLQLETEIIDEEYPRRVTLFSGHSEMASMTWAQFKDAVTAGVQLIHTAENSE